MKTGPRPELELVALLVEDVDAGDVGREQVRRELQAGEAAVERAGERLCEHRLADAGKVLDDQVSLGDEAEDDESQGFFRRVHDAAEIRGDRLKDVRGSRL